MDNQNDLLSMSRQYEDPIFLITNIPNTSYACWYFERRFRIETFFSDQKSRGFQINKSHLSDPRRLSRLLIYLTDRIDKSIFRLGLDWLKYTLNRGLHFEVHYHFQPAHSAVNVRSAILNMTRFFGSSPKKVLNYRPMWEISGRNRANFKIPSRNNRHIENC